MNAADTIKELRDRRKAAKLTQAHVAAAMDWPTSTVCSKEKGSRDTWLREVDRWRAALEELGA